MGNSTIRVTLTTGGDAKELDIDALSDDLGAEVDNLVVAASGTMNKTRDSAPPDAQGVDLVIEWLLEIAQDPSLYPTYVKTFLFALNQVAERHLGKHSEKGDGGSGEHETPEDENQQRSLVVELKEHGKTLRLPVAIAVIKKTLEELQD